MRKVMKKACFLLMGVIVATSSICASAAPKTSYYKSNDSTAGWSVNVSDNGSTWTVVDDPVDDYSMSITKEANDVEGKTYINLEDAKKPDGCFVLEYDFKLEKYNACLLGALWGYSNNVLTRINQVRTTSSGGVILGTSSDTPLDGVSYLAGEWNHVKQITDLSAGVTHFYLNDIRIGVANNSATLNKLGRFDFGFHANAAQNSELLVDNVCLYKLDGNNVCFIDKFTKNTLDTVWNNSNATLSAVKNDADKCMVLSRNSTTNAKGQAMYNFGENNKPAGKVVIEYRFCLNELSPAYIGDMYAFKGDSLLRLGHFRTTSSGGVILTPGGSQPVSGVTYAAKTWYKVKQIVDFDKHNITYYLDDKQIGTVDSDVEMSRLARLDFGFYESAATNKKMYVDDIVVYQYEGEIKLTVDDRVSTGIGGIIDNSVVKVECEMPWNNVNTGILIIALYENGNLKDVGMSNDSKGQGYYTATVNCGELSESGKYEIRVFRWSGLTEMVPEYNVTVYEK